MQRVDRVSKGGNKARKRDGNDDDKNDNNDDENDNDDDK
jgi:hypothetical protein